MTALTPLPERNKADWLRSKDTKARLQCCIHAMTSLLTNSPSHDLSTNAEDEEVEDGDEISQDNAGQVVFTNE